MWLHWIFSRQLWEPGSPLKGGVMRSPDGVGLPGRLRSRPFFFFL